jgi:hypothetical protein
VRARRWFPWLVGNLRTTIHCRMTRPHLSARTSICQITVRSEVFNGLPVCSSSRTTTGRAHARRVTVSSSPSPQWAARRSSCDNGRSGRCSAATIRQLFRASTVCRFSDVRKVQLFSRSGAATLVGPATWS